MVKQIEICNNELVDIKIKAVFDTMDNARKYFDRCYAEDPDAEYHGIFYEIEEFEVQ